MKMIQSKIVRVVIASVATGFALLNLYLFMEVNQSQEENRTILAQINQNNLTFKRAQSTEHLQKNLHHMNECCDRVGLGQRLSTFAQELNLQKLEFKVSPEEKISQVPRPFRKSRIELQLQNSEDFTLYAFITGVLEEFPGLAVPQEFILERDSHSKEPVIKGRFTYDWITVPKPEIKS